MTRLLLLLTLVASASFAQTYVRPSKGTAFYPFSASTVTVTPGPLRYLYSSGYDWSAFDAARIRIYSEDAVHSNGSGTPCNLVPPYQYTATNFAANIRFVVIRSGLVTPQIAVSVQDAPSLTGPWAFASPTGNYRSEFSNCDVKIMVTPIAFAPNILQGLDPTTGTPYSVSVDPTTGALLTSGSGGGGSGGTSTVTDAGVSVTVPTCTTTQNGLTSVGTSSAYVPSILSALPGRWMIRICNSPRNSGTPIITCTTDGQLPDAGLTGVGESLEVGDCATYTTSAGVQCISDTASTAVSSWECR